MWQALIQKAMVCGQRSVHSASIRRAYDLKAGADVYRQHIAMPGNSYDVRKRVHSKCELAGKCVGNMVYLI